MRPNGEFWNRATSIAKFQLVANALKFELMIQVLLNSAPRFQADGPLAEIASMKSADHEQVRERSGGGQPGPSPVSDLDEARRPPGAGRRHGTAGAARGSRSARPGGRGPLRGGPGQASSPSSRIADATSRTEDSPTNPS